MATFAEEELDEDLIREARANSQHLLGTPMADAFKNYGADRAKQAKDAALQAKLADALKTGVKLDEARLNPNAAREYDARVAADVARAAAAAHGTVSDDDDDDDDGGKPAEAENLFRSAKSLAPREMADVVAAVIAQSKAQN